MQVHFNIVLLKCIWASMIEPHLVIVCLHVTYLQGKHDETSGAGVLVERRLAMHMQIPGANQ